MSGANFHLHFENRGQEYDLDFQELQSTDIFSNSVIIDGQKYCILGERSQIDFLRSLIPEFQTQSNLSMEELRSKIASNSIAGAGLELVIPHEVITERLQNYYESRDRSGVVPLGNGSEGVVFKVEYEENGQRKYVAVKVHENDNRFSYASTDIETRNPDYFKLFQSEMNKVGHPSLMKVLGFSSIQINSRRVLVEIYEYLDVVPYHQVFNGKSHEEKIALFCSLTAQLIGALHAMHKNGFEHRDIHGFSGACFVFTNETPPRAKIIDFGAVKEKPSAEEEIPKQLQKIKNGTTIERATKSCEKVELAELIHLMLCLADSIFKNGIFSYEHKERGDAFSELDRLSNLMRGHASEVTLPVIEHMSTVMGATLAEIQLQVAERQKKLTDILRSEEKHSV